VEGDVRRCADRKVKKNMKLLRLFIFGLGVSKGGMTLRGWSEDAEGSLERWKYGKD